MANGSRWWSSREEARTRLTFGGTNNHPIWRPDGHSVVFANIGNGLFQTRADGASQPQVLTQSQTLRYPSSFTPDGTRLAYSENPEGAQVWTVPLEDQGE